MEQFIITHIDGSTISLRQRSTVINVTRATQSVELLGNDVVDISVESAVKLYFQIGDKITIIGRDYTLNIPPKETKLSENKFRYDLQFEGVQYDLSRITYDVNIDTTGSDLYADALTGNMKLFLDVLIANINRVFPGKWVLGTYPDDTETKTLTFSETDNCLAVLQRLCEEYNQEFDIAIAQNGTRTINIGQAGKTIAFTFQYGKGKGIYELTREKVSSSNIVNRLKVYGGSKNISAKYRATRLCLPGKNKAQSYIENAESIAKYGIWENAIYFEDIFPQRTGVVTALGDTILKFVDNTMDFDLNEKEADGVTTKYLLAGTPAKVHFNTGNLAGYEFEITSYDHATKMFTIRAFKDERDMEFPSETSAAFRFAVGDEYVLLDIAMPQSYIDAAEQKLLEKGQEYLSQNCQPKVQYSLKLVEFFLKKTFGTDVETNIFWVGDYIPIKDDDLEVDKLIRVKGFTRDLLKECSYNLTISDLAVTRSIYNRIISDLIDIDKIIQINDLANVAKARRNWLNAQEVLGMVFDVEGDYYTDKIKPQSIETMMLSVGAKSMQFVLVGTVFQPNYGGNKNRVVYKGGTLTHYAIVDENNNPRYWVLQDGDVTVTNDFQAYYIYAKCEKNGTGGIILFSDQQIQAEQDTNYYHFLIGVLNSVDAELHVRSISLTYGFTTINGKFIRTGRIDSIDGKTYFDLDNSVIGGKIRFVSTGGDEQDMGEWVETTEEALSIITSDNYLSASEKPSQRKEWETVYSERNGLISQATNFGITTEKDNYSNAFQALSTYLNGGTTWTSGVPLWINDASLSVDTAIIGTTYRQKWVDLYSAKAALTNAIQIKIDQLSTDKVNGIQMGDRNLLRNSNPNVTNNLYPTVALSLSDEGKKLIEGEQVTIIIKGELGAGKTNFGIFNSNDYVRMVDISPSSFVNGIATKTFNWKIYHPTYPASNTSVKIFAMPSSSANSTVEWVKLVRGNKVTTDWTPAPEDVQAEIEEVSNAVTDLDTYVDGAFKDSVINSAEAKAIAEHLKTLAKEKTDVDNEYTTIYNNALLTGTPKTNLANAKTDIDSKYTALVNAINTAITDSAITDAERTNVNTGFTNYGNSLKVFTQRIDEALTAISNQQAIKASEDAYNQLSDLASDNKLTPADKQATKKEWDIIVAEKPTIEAQATTYGITTEKTNYVNAYNTLSTYITPLLSNLTETSDIVGTTFRDNFKNYYDKKVILLEAISDKAKQLADAAQAAADAAQTDASEALSKANTSKAITDKFGTTVDGGLINTVMMLLREFNSLQETAGISGIQGELKNNPAFWAGGTYAQAFAFLEFLSKMSAGTAPSSGEYEALAKIVMLHNGAAKIGDFIIEQTGRIVMVDPVTGKPRLVFSVQDIPLISDLVGNYTENGTVNIGSGYVSSDPREVILSGSLNITKNGSTIIFGGNTLYINISTEIAGAAAVTLTLLRNGTPFKMLGYVSLSAGGSGQTENKSDSFTISPITLTGVPGGTYTIQLSLSVTSGIFASGSCNPSTLSWNFTQAGIRFFQFGVNGMMAYFSDNHWYFTESGGFDLRGKTNMPGVLLSASVGTNGTFSNWWGAKKHATQTAVKNSTGRYTVYHSVGHTNYQVTASSAIANRSYHIVSRDVSSFIIEWRTIGSSPALTDTMFDFQITGNNYN